MKPVIVEFKSEYDKWTILRNKADFRKIEEYRSFLKRWIGQERSENEH